MKTLNYSMLFAIVMAISACGSGSGGGGGEGNVTDTEPCSTLNASDPDWDSDGLPDCYDKNAPASYHPHQA